MLLQIKNRSTRDHYRVSGSLFVETVLYTGRNRDHVKSVDFDQNIPPESIEVIEMEVTFYDYFKKLLDQAAFSISCIAKVHDTDFDYYAQDDFRVRKPDVKIKLQGIPEVDQEIDVILRLANPLPNPLKNCMFHIQGTGLERQLQLKVGFIYNIDTNIFSLTLTAVKTEFLSFSLIEIVYELKILHFSRQIPEVPVDGIASTTFKYIPPYSGRATFAANFFSKQLNDCDGFISFEVAPRPSDVYLNGNYRPRGYIERRNIIP